MSWQTPARCSQASAAPRRAGRAGDVLDLARRRARTPPRAAPGARGPRDLGGPGGQVVGRAARGRASRGTRSSRRRPRSLASSSHDSAGAGRGPVGACTVDGRGDRHRLVRVEHLERGDLGAEVVAVVVGPRRRATPRAGCATTIWSGVVSGRHPGLVVRRDRRPSYSKPVVCDDRAAACMHRAPPCQLSRLGAGEVAPRDRVGRQRAGALQPLHLGGQVGDHVGQRAVLELGAGPAEQPLRLVLEAGALRRRLEVLEALLGPGEREDDRAREQPVEQQELRRAALGLEARGRCAGRPRRRRRRAAIVVHGAGRPRSARRWRPAARSCRRARCSGRAPGSASPRRGSSSSRRCR